MRAKPKLHKVDAVNEETINSSRWNNYQYTSLASRG